VELTQRRSEGAGAFACLNFSLLALGYQLTRFSLLLISLQFRSE